jgi:hypothetical protein
MPLGAPSARGKKVLWVATIIPQYGYGYHVGASDDQGDFLSRARCQIALEVPGEQMARSIVYAVGSQDRHCCTMSAWRSLVRSLLRPGNEARMIVLR